MTAPNAETPIDRAFNATDLPYGEFRAFKAGWEAMGGAVAEWLRAEQPSFIQAAVFRYTADALEAEFLPEGAPND